MKNDYYIAAADVKAVLETAADRLNMRDFIKLWRH
jgi:hypothetical protein